MIGIQEIVPYIVGVKRDIEGLINTSSFSDLEKEYYHNCGIQSIYDSGDISSFELALGACNQLLDESSIDPSRIDVIIYIKSRTPEFLISSDATRLKEEIKAEKALTFTIGDLGCVDISMALKLSKDMLISNRNFQNVIIAYGNKQFSNSRFRYPVNVLGDAGIAVLVTRSERNKIVDIKLESNGKYWDLFQLDFKNKSMENYKEMCTDIRKYTFELAIESKNRFKSINNSILEDNNLKEKDINFYLMQNISDVAYHYYETAFDINIYPICKHNLSQYGHLGPIDIMLNYHSGLKEGMFPKNSNVLIMNNSPAAAWSSILMRV